MSNEFSITVVDSGVQAALSALTSKTEDMEPVMQATGTETELKKVARYQRQWADASELCLAILQAAKCEMRNSALIDPGFALDSGS